ncbi:MAG: putative dienelactone hydrolase [Myxococcota bacterium]|jgi:predicted dienelactone hydrolase
MMFLLMMACSPDPLDTATTPAVDPMSWSVQEDGPLSVGYRMVTHTYTDPAGEVVEVPISIWYPTEDTDGEEAVYFSFQEDLEAFADASLAAPLHDGGYPVMIFSHGSFLYGGSSSYIARRFASHGWVVAAPDHLGNTVTDYGDDPPLPIYYRRPLNDSAAIDSIDADSALGGVAKTDEVVLVGYSFGGYDSWTSYGADLDVQAFLDQCDADAFSEPCTEAQRSAIQTDLAEPRVVAIIPLAGAGRFEYFADGGLQGLGPVLQMSGTEDQDDPQQMWDLSEGTPMTWVSIEGGCHEMFSVGGCSTIERQDGYDLINAYTFGFARQQLLGSSDETAALLSGELLPWSIVNLTRR